MIIKCVFVILYAYNMLTQVLDHYRDFYVDQEVLLDFFIEKLCFCEREKQPSTDEKVLKVTLVC